MKEQPVKSSGSCYCGAVCYECEVFLKSGYYCHCGICQRTSGQSGEMAIPVKSGTLRFTNIEPKYFVSSEFGKRGFCPECGSRIVWKANDPDLDWLTNVTVGTLDRGKEAEPTLHLYVESKMPWLEITDSLPQYTEEQIDEIIEKWRSERVGE